VASIKEVARTAGVSISTVSHVLNNTKYVSSELRDKVMRAAKTLDYEANPVARNMKSGFSQSIGIITADICGVFYPYVVKEVCLIARGRDFNAAIFDVNSSYDYRNAQKKEKECFKRLLASRADGIIFVSSVKEEEVSDFLDDIREVLGKKKEVPLVSLERDFSRFNIDSVYVDNISGAETAVNHLVKCGCSRIAHITGPTGMQIVQDRIHGYLTAMRKAKLDVDAETMICDGNYSHQSGYVAMEHLIGKHRDLDGVFVANDQMAIGAMKYLKERGIKIPEDIKFIGYDDVFVSSIVEPQLSTIHVPKRYMGKRAAEILFQRIDDLKKKNRSGVKTVREELKTRLVERRSTVTEAASDWTLSEW
jgi:DNA-binding LacI/PurR family transcriptional regulator